MEKKDSTKLIPIISFFSAVGTGLSIWQTKLFYATRSGLADFHSFCNINQTFDCTAIEMSKYSELFAGIPLSAVAIAGYVLIFILSLFGLNSTFRKTIRPVLLTLTSIALLFSLAYLAIMIIVIGKLCLFCLLIDGVNVLLFLAAFKLPKKDPNTVGITLGHVIGAGLASIIIAFMFAKGLDPLAEMKKEDMNDMVESVLSTPAITLQVPSDAPMIGDPKAPITIVKFSDYECPACRLGATAIHPLFKRKDVKFIFVNYPLDLGCNPNVPRRMHQFACEAAEVAICATEQGKFNETYEILFENQKDFAKDKIADLLVSKLKGLDSAKLKNCMTLPSTMEKIKRDVKLGKEVNIQSTPTFFINGKKVEGGLPTHLWIQIIDRMAGGAK